MLDLLIKECYEMDCAYILVAGSVLMAVYLIFVWCISRFLHRGTSAKVVK